MTSPSRVSTSDRPTVTVLVMSYKYGHLVCHALETVIGQTNPPDVIKVYDDGVGDCFFVGEKYPEIELIEREKNLGIVDNFNDALRHTTTEWVLFLGADNYLHPQTLELLMSHNIDADIISYDAYIIGDGNYKRWVLPSQPHGSAMYKVKKALEVGGYEPSGRLHTEEDSMLFKKMIDNGCVFSRVDKPLLYYRRHRENFNK